LLREKLVEKQRELNLRDGKMAAELGIPRSSYSSVKTGRYRISRTVMLRIIAVFPELTPYALTEDAPTAEAE
jgi:DNA-binding XRE family transcriptional regulator